MYIPKHFSIDDNDEINRFIRANAFGQMVSQSEGKLVATHLPLLLSADSKVLTGHVAKANPQWQKLEGQEVLVILQGPHGYISPSWYSQQGVPTWNYQAVHIYGHASHFSDSERLAKIVNDLSNEYESGFESPWTPYYPVGKLRGIIGIEITICDIQCKFKLSQNHVDEDRRNVARNLTSLGQESLAKAMLEQID